MLRIVGCAVVFLTVGFAQTPAGGARFEVVSIKPVPRPTPEGIRDGTTRIAYEVNGGRVRISGYGVLSVVPRAFQVEPAQIDGKGFTAGDYYDIEAKIPEGAKPEQVPEMLQAMLTERFKLAYHREMREYQMNVLTLGKSGMKLPRLAEGTKASAATTRAGDGSSRMTSVGNVKSLFAVMNSFGGLQMKDETGLDGMYTWVMNLPGPGGGGSFQDIMQESFKAMIEEAGLKLENRKISRETIVVDHLENKPTEN
ncbi:MAG TPA: TIGR03435 family protein [Bryobacteraceae bacterium]|jgi:uncharacterized protein (TIGR03435 family)